MPLTPEKKDAIRRECAAELMSGFNDLIESGRRRENNGEEIQIIEINHDSSFYEPYRNDFK